MSYTLSVIPSDEYDRLTYGILLVSATTHAFNGPRIHNRHHQHQLKIWANRDGKDPHGVATDEPYAYLWSPQANIISRHAIVTPPPGAPLALGEVVELAVNGYPIGRIRLDARPLHNPYGIPVDENGAPR